MVRRIEGTCGIRVCTADGRRLKSMEAGGLSGARGWLTWSGNARAGFILRSQGKDKRATADNADEIVNDTY